MVNETSGENLLEFSKKMLNEAFGPSENDTEETLLPKVEDPGKGRSLQTSTIGPSHTTSEPKINPRPEQKKVETNALPLQEQETSSDLVTSIETKNSSISDDTKDIPTDISTNSKEDT